MITRVSCVIRPKGSDLMFDHPYNAESVLVWNGPTVLTITLLSAGSDRSPAGSRPFRSPRCPARRGSGNGRGRAGSPPRPAGLPRQPVAVTRSPVRPARPPVAPAAHRRPARPVPAARHSTDCPRAEGDVRESRGERSGCCGWSPGSVTLGSGGGAVRGGARVRRSALAGQGAHRGAGVPPGPARVLWPARWPKHSAVPTRGSTGWLRW
jgi:hypothetical protein